MNTEDVQSTQLPQSKSYLKILSIPYLIEGMNTSINTSIIKTIIKITHVFNNVQIASKLRVVKVFPKSNMAICHMQVHLSGNNVPAVKPPPNHTSPPSTVATFLVTHLMVVL